MQDSVDLENNLPETKELLMEGNFKFEPSHPGLREIAWIFNDKETFTEENIQALQLHPKPMALSETIILLHKTGILNQQNLKIILSHQESDYIAFSLYYLHKVAILTKENFERVLWHQELTPIVLSLRYLQETGMLTQANFEHVLRHREPISIADEPTKHLDRHGCKSLMRMLQGYPSHYESKFIYKAYFRIHGGFFTKVRY